MDDETVVRMDKDSYLSNFYPCTVYYEGLVYGSSESAYQSQKCLNPDDRLKFSMVGSWSDPAISQQKGNEVPIVPNWDDIKLAVMYDVVLNKFLQHPDLAIRLMRLEGKHIVEENRHGDTYWGKVNGAGENHLGIILDDVGHVLRYVRDTKAIR